MRGYGLGWISALALTSRGSDRVVAVRVHGADLRRTLWLATPVDARLGEPAAALAQRRGGLIGRVDFLAVLVEQSLSLGGELAALVDALLEQLLRLLNLPERVIRFALRHCPPPIRNLKLD